MKRGFHDSGKIEFSTL